MAYDYYGRLAQMDGSLNNPYTAEGWRNVQDFWGDRDIGEPFVQQSTLPGIVKKIQGPTPSNPYPLNKQPIMATGGTMAVNWQDYDVYKPPMSLGGAAGGNLGALLGDPVNNGNIGNPPAANPLSNIFSGLGNIAGNNWLGYAALAFGGYRAFRSRRVNLVTLGLLVYGLWSIGWISPSLLPRDENGNINFMVLGLSVILPPTAAALVGGVSGVIVSTLARQLFRRRRTFRRRFSSYRRRYFPRRRYYRRRR